MNTIKEWDTAWKIIVALFAVLTIYDLAIYEWLTAFNTAVTMILCIVVANQKVLIRKQNDLIDKQQMWMLNHREW